MATGSRASFATLSINLEARLANLEQGLAEATKKTETAANRMSASLESVSKTGSRVGQALAGYFSGKFFVDLVTGAINAQDHLNDLAKKTQLTVEQVGGIGFAAKQAGADVDVAATSFGKLNLTIAKAASGDKQATALFDAIKVKATDASGAARDSGKVFADLADRFASYADGPEKAALGNAIFGKSYQTLLPLLQDGGAKLRENISFFEKYSGVSTESAAKADEFNDSLEKLHLLSSAFGTNLANALLPTLQAVVDRFIAFKEEGTGTGGMVQALTSFINGLVITVGYLVERFASLGRTIGTVIAQTTTLHQSSKDVTFESFSSLSAFGNLLDNGPVGFVKKALERNASTSKTLTDRLKKEDDAGSTAFKKLFDDITLGPVGPDGHSPGGGARGADRAPPVPKKPGRTPVDDPAAKQLAATLAMLQEGVKAEQQLLGERNQILDLYNSRSLLSIKDYYEQRSNIAKLAFDKEEADTIARVAVLEQALDQAKADKDPKHKPLQKQADIQKQLAQATADLASLREKFGVSQLIDSEKQKFAQEDFNKTLDATSAKVFELQGHLTAAAAINFNQANDSLRKLFTANNNTDGLKLLDTLHAHAVALAQIDEIKQKSAREDEALQNAEERLSLAQQAGATGELSTLAAVGKLRAGRLRLMEQEVSAQESIARVSNDPALIQSADKARLAMEKLKATVDPLAEKLNGIFENSFNNAFDGFISGSRNAAQAFGDFAKSVAKDLLKLASQGVAKSIFGGSGSAGGFLSSLVSLLRGGGNVNTSAGYISGVDMGFSMAAGGTLQPNRVSRVNEHGPELLTVQGKDYLMTGNRAAKVTPVSGGTGGPNITIQIAAGVQRNELAALIPGLKAQIKAELVASSRRPGYAGAGA